jgi:cytochrome c biogenesis protein CcmG, thiol:disulfide interchange protein DsbE
VSNKPSRQTSASAKVRAASDSSRGSTTWLWVGLAVIIVVVGIVAVIIGRSSDSSSSAAGGGPSPSGGTVVPNGDLSDPTVTVQGTALTKLPSSGSDPAVGESIPTISGETFDSSGITISPADGPQVIMVIAHWCPHCRAEVPRLQDWLDQNHMPSDVKLTAIATANDSSAVNYPASDWLRGAGWSVPTILDDASQSGALAVGTSAYPFFVVVDAQGKVVFRTSGELTMPQWEQLLDSARTGQAPAGS